MRPIGGWLFGRIADRRGVKPLCYLGVHDVLWLAGDRLLTGI
jgi:hypothetical protein